MRLKFLPFLATTQLQAYLANKRFLALTTINPGEARSLSELKAAMATLPPAYGIVAQSVVSLWAWGSVQDRWLFSSPALEAVGASKSKELTDLKGYLDFAAEQKKVGQGTELPPQLAKKCHWRRRERPSGFTLLELLVVLVIIGLLAAYVGPRYFSQIGKSEAKVAKAQIDAFEKALDQYRIDIGRFPSQEEGLAVLVSASPQEPKWAGPYLKKDVPKDPWGRPYEYRIPGQRNDFDIISYGRDGRPGGEGEEADITSW